MALDKEIGIWKSGSGKGKKKPRGRQANKQALEEVKTLLRNSPRRKDLLIEFLHLIQDKFGHISANHISALAEEMLLSQTEIFEVATFYAHFDVIKEGELPPPPITIRVCDSLSCELNGARDILETIRNNVELF